MEKKILIFDDDTDILELCKYVLNKKGFEVHTRERCDDIIQTLEEVKPDLVLMDNWIPEVGGVEATQAIKNHPGFKEMPVIYFSANSEVQKLAKQAGADEFIAKPFDLTHFENTISGFLNKL
jgi:DNA-binding NtrC family response regulator